MVVFIGFNESHEPLPSGLGCAFRFVFRFLPGFIFRNLFFFLRNPRNSAEHTSELNHSKAKLICSGIRQNPEFRPEFQREGRTRDCPERVGSLGNSTSFHVRG